MGIVKINGLPVSANALYRVSNLLSAKVIPPDLLPYLKGFNLAPLEDGMVFSVNGGYKLFMERVEYASRMELSPA